ncbi:unnamed protein product, partial [marine sediment metagenome]
LNFDNHSRDEAVNQLFGQMSYHLRMCIAGQYNLFTSQIDCIESMQEFLLR